MSYDVERGRGYQGGVQSGTGAGFRSAGNSYGTEDPLVSALKENIRQVSNNVSNITKLVNILGTPRDSQETREKLNSTIETTKLIIRNATQQIKDLGHNVRGSQEERNAQKMLQQKLTKDFTLWLEKFQEITKISAQKERSTPVPASNANAGFAAQPAPGARNGGSAPAWGKQQQQSQQDQYHQFTDHEADEKQGLLEASKRDNLLAIENEREFTDAMIQDRDEGIKQIESTLTEVGGIFQDLAQIVHEQQYMIDNIESNVESANHHTSEAVVELRKASTYQKKSRTKLCWLTLIIVIVIAVIAVAIYFGLKF